MKIHHLLQGSPNWFAIRKLKLTASNAQAIATAGKGLESLVDEIVAEYLSSGNKEHYTNDNIERGIELEATARGIYELQNGVTVDEVGFVEMNKYVGYSPDGLVGKDGLIEIKSLSDVPHFKHIINGSDEIDTKYAWQCEMGLLVTKRKWLDFISYNPNFSQAMFIHRFYPDKERQEKLLKGIEKGTEMIKQRLKLYEGTSTRYS